MKLLVLIVLLINFCHLPALALTDRAKRILGISTDAPLDYMAVACTYLDAANHRKPMGKVMLLKQKVESAEKYSGSFLLKKGSFSGTKIAHFETKEFHGQTSFEGLSVTARNELFKQSWKNAKPMDDAELDLNSLGHFTFNFNSLGSVDYTRVLINAAAPEYASFKKGYTGRNVHMSCVYFAIPLEDSKANTPTDNNECIVGPADPDCEPLDTASDS